ncbi:hypothetical protein C8R45DRAFT_1016544 [Mycena sanguinolenta]|nr:hypothetical protein C8R45DRAFT_1016544 [Mycena sanguinolenta]
MDCWGTCHHHLVCPVARSCRIVHMFPYSIVSSFWSSGRPPWLIVSVSCSATLCIGEFWLRDQFQQYMRDMSVIQCADYLVAGDSLSFGQARERNWPLLRYLRGLLRRRGPIFLPGDDSLEIDGIPSATTSTQEQSLVPWNIPSELREAVLHYSRLGADSMWPTKLPLWITADTGNRCSAIVREVSRIVCSSESGICVDVDISSTHSVFWPLVRALAVALPAYREVLAMDPAGPFKEHFHCYPVSHSPSSPISPYDEDYSRLEIIQTLICEPLAERAKTKMDPQRVLLIIHGVRDQAQANEIYATICELKEKKGNEDVGLVVVSDPRLLRATIEDDEKAMRCICTLYASESRVLYSGTALTPPAFYETIFRLLVDGIHRVGGPEAERLWNNLPDFSSLAEFDSLPMADVDPSHSTLSFFSMLYGASEIRRKILECLFEITAISRSRINEALVEDNIKVAEMLPLLFAIRSYKKDIPALPKEHAMAALNLTHYILDSGLPENDTIQNYSIFSRHAHLLLNRLSRYLQLLPEEIEINGVVLLGDHPIKHGGFSDIYHGIYMNPAGEQQEVALKVLRIFEDKSDHQRNVLHAKFSKEAVLWYYLHHENIVPFLGVDSTTFPSPARAMVSPWMPLGSVLKYMRENSPSSLYALELLCGAINGLNYLHSMNIVHGDLCARNILMDKSGRARLTDFGLAAFIESDTSMKSTTRSGSTRWMAPELFRPAQGVPFKRTPASDVWAFGCVCCEIWSEGTVPFNRIRADEGVPVSFSTGDAIPYPSTLHDKAGNPMPDRLWELAQWC